ncbi:MATE efflux family protein subfamily, putative [Talaromyces stipitatus ATCC 10500]|uniref:MATE efflux family protein subfamily, putative n=1 Tax=Talaromyces stipitatus (strain ATCC 10500 / CBS 375.48 / QM 6759 / NRRL 1006) TaxID=441959 RepID=B8MET3_TALSN|nr:MATE efflux family protein subfamily, putative [Talaromyces stipitatus ATCC 10500]EED16966.1 MATE efflux family protein subfamily, putative [Talaromyces stipitatus ATCC 10500]
MALNNSSPLAIARTDQDSQSLTSGASTAQTVIARDIASYNSDNRVNQGNDDDDDNDNDFNGLVRSATNVLGTTPHSLAGSYRRPSYFTAGSRGTVVPHHSQEQYLTIEELERAYTEEIDLLSDNRVIEPDSSKRNALSARLPSPGQNQQDPHAPITAPTETSALLGDQAPLVNNEIDRKWEEAVTAGLIQSTWRREARVIGQYSLPLIVTFLLQYSLTVASIFTVGHLGTVELGAVSLASMTVSITGSAVYQGLATSLDTLCAQAYGSGRKKLVGLQMQRMVFFLWVVTIPIAIIWLLADKILVAIIPETEVALLAGQYLKVVILGAPGYACFESGKRFVQAQGIFTASLYVLLICAPLNAFMNWFFVWKLEMGFIGAPIAVAITENLLPLFLFLYVYFVGGRECWNGFTWRAFQNWGPMIRLALPGLIMVEAECLAFEVLTLVSSYLGTEALAAQSILSTISSITFQIPFPVAIAGSTRVANLIGATLVDAARTAARVALTGAVIVGLLNMLILSLLRYSLAGLFTSDEEVIEMVAAILPICAAFQLFDALAANCNGILRGLGRQEIGGYVQVFCYYVVAMPISMGTAFGLGWGISGLWTGVAIALGLVFFIEIIFLRKTSWERSVEEARKRNDVA